MRVRAASKAPAPALARHAGALVALAFLALGLATLTDWGITWDEPESYGAGIANLRIVGAALAGRALPSWPWHELPGYQFAGDTARSAVAECLDRLFWRAHDVWGYHLVDLLMTSAAVLLLACLARREGGPLLAPLAATLLIVQPKLVAHAQANPKDTIALLVWTAAMLALARAAERRRWRDYLLLGVAIGVAVASHVTALLLLPIAAVWVLATPPRSGPAEPLAGAELRDVAAAPRPMRRRPLRALAGLVVVGVMAVATALALWPWLWPAPLARTLQLARHVARFDVDMRVLYLGRLYHPTALPWHYGLVSLLIATPVPVLLLAAIGVARAFRAGDPRRRIVGLAALWLLALLLADVRAPAHYDGARHLLPALPALALLAAAGAEWLLVAARSRRARAAVAAALALALLALAVELARVHPYADAFLDLPARWALGPEAEHQVELEYWCNSYREAAAWILAHTTRDTAVLVPMGAHAMAPLLAGRRALVPHDGSSERRPQVLVLMTREAWYTPRERALMARAAPLFTIRRQGSTLLAIYRAR